MNGSAQILEAVRRHYDELDWLYRDVWGEHVHHGLWTRGDESPAQAVEALAHLVAEEADLHPAQRVCDIGCGYGATARLLAAHYGARVTGLTISPAQYEFALSVSGPADNPRYFLADWLANDLGTATFDALIAIESSEHMASMERFFAEAHRLLRENGRFVICAWLRAEDVGLASRRFLLEPICREGRLERLGTESAYRRWAEGAGFEVVGFQDLTQRVQKTWTICIGRFVGRLFTRRAYRRVLLDRVNGNRIFGLTMLRLWVAYRVGAMRYGVFTLEKR